MTLASESDVRPTHRCFFAAYLDLLDSRLEAFLGSYLLRKFLPPLDLFSVDEGFGRETDFSFYVMRRLAKRERIALKNHFGGPFSLLACTPGHMK